MVSYQGSQGYLDCCSKVLILVVVEDGLVLPLVFDSKMKLLGVLILVVVEDGLVPLTREFQPAGTE